MLLSLEIIADPPPPQIPWRVASPYGTEAIGLIDL